MALELQQAPAQAPPSRPSPGLEGPTPTGGGNQAMLEALGLGAQGPGGAGSAYTPAAPRPADGGAAAAAPTSGATGGDYVLARGKQATQAEVAILEGSVKAAVEAWGGTYVAGSVVLVGAGGATPTVELTWNPAWGAAPTTKDLTGSLQPVEAQAALKALKAAAGWAKVPADDQARLAALVGGETNLYSSEARAALRPMIVGSKATAEDQAKSLTGLLTDAAARPDLVTETTAGLVAQPYVAAGPTKAKAHAFQGKTADANVYTMTFADKQVITIYEPVRMGKDMQTHTVDQVYLAVATLPVANRKAVKTVSLNPVVNPDDAYWAKEYKTPDFHSYMTAGAGGEVTIYPDKTAPMDQDYMNSTMIHESAHSWSGKKWGADRAKGGWKLWKAAMVADKISVCDYATASIDEDVAETTTVYASAKGTPKHDEYRAMVPNRFKILDADFN